MPIDARVRRARARLEQLLAAHPAVRLIDVGLARDAEAARSGSRVVLRVHLAAGTDRGSLGIPGEVDGVPVHVMTGDYRPE